MRKRKPHSEKTKKKISMALKKRKLSNHAVKGARAGGYLGAGLGALNGALSGTLAAGPLGTIPGAILGGGSGAISGTVTGAGTGGVVYGVRRGADKLRRRKKYSYEYSTDMDVGTIEFGRGKDKKKRKRRNRNGMSRTKKVALVGGGVAAIGGLGLVARYGEAGLDGYQKAARNNLNKDRTKQVVKRNIKRAFRSDVNRVKDFIRKKK